MRSDVTDKSAGKFLENQRIVLRRVNGVYEIVGHSAEFCGQEPVESVVYEGVTADFTRWAPRYVLYRERR
jgi:hypothetical protein